MDLLIERLSGGDARRAIQELASLCASDGRARADAGRLGAIPLLVSHLSSGTMQEMTARALVNVCVDTNNELIAARAGAIDVLVRQLDRPGCAAVSLMMALRAVCWSSDERRAAAGHAGAIGILTKQLKSTAEEAQREAMATLFVLCLNANNQVAALREGTIPALVDQLSRGRHNLILASVKAMCSICANVANGSTAVRAGALERLIALLRDDSEELQQWSLRALINICSCYETNKAAAVQEAAISALQRTLSRNPSKETVALVARAFAELYSACDILSNEEQASLIRSMMHCWRIGSPEAGAHAVRALIQYCTNDASGNRCTEAANSGALTIAIGFLSHQSPALQVGGATVLAALCTNDTVRAMAVQCGAIACLVQRLYAAETSAVAGAVAYALACICRGRDDQLPTNGQGVFYALIHMIGEGRFDDAAKEKGALALGSMCEIPENQAQAGTANAIPPLVALLRSANEGARDAAAAALGLICLASDNRERAANADAIPALIWALEHASNQTTGHAAAALWAICTDSELAKRAVDGGAVAPLASLLVREASVVKDRAAGALSVLCAAVPSMPDSACGNAIPELIRMLQCRCESSQRAATMALCAICLDGNHRAAATRHGALAALTALCDSSTVSALTLSWAVRAICNICADTDGKRAAARAGAIATVVSLLNSTTDNKVKADAAMALCSICWDDNEHRVIAARAGALDVLNRASSGANAQAREQIARARAKVFVHADAWASVGSQGVQRIVPLLQDNRPPVCAIAAAVLANVCSTRGVLSGAKTRKQTATALVSALDRMQDPLVARAVLMALCYLCRNYPSTVKHVKSANGVAILVRLVDRMADTTDEMRGLAVIAALIIQSGAPSAAQFAAASGVRDSVRAIFINALYVPSDRALALWALTNMWRNDANVCRWAVQTGMMAQLLHWLTLGPESARSEAVIALCTLCAGDANRHKAATQAATVGGAAATAMAPNGKYLAFVASDGRIQVWDTVAYRVKNVIDPEQPHPAILCFSGDSSYLACCSSNGFIELCQVATGECNLRARIDQTPVRIESVQQCLEAALSSGGLPGSA